jgi:hypothetical protein
VVLILLLTVGVTGLHLFWRSKADHEGSMKAMEAAFAKNRFFTLSSYEIPVAAEVLYRDRVRHYCWSFSALLFFFYLCFFFYTPLGDSIRSSSSQK